MWLSFKGKSFRQAFSSIKRLDYKDFQNVVKYSLKTSGKCAFTNSHLALITHGESFLSNSDAFDYMKLIYHSTKNCIGKQKDENASRIHLRIGLLYLLEGELKEAKKAFLKSSKIRNSSEHFRALFWLGLLHAELDEETAFNYEGNIYWRRLLSFYPYTLHSIIVSRALGRDPLMNIVDKNKSMYLRNRISKSFGSDDVKAFVFELLHSRKLKAASRQWARMAIKTTKLKSPELTLFWIKAANLSYLHREAIFLCSRYLEKTNYKNVNEDFFKLMFPISYVDKILSHSKSVDPIIALSLIRQESAFDSRARSIADARGLMQVLPRTASEIMDMSGGSLYDPDINIYVGLNYLEKLFFKYDGQIEFVLAAYNAGHFNLDKWRKRVSEDNMLLFLDLIPFKETRNYVAVILRNSYWYNQVLDIRDDMASLALKEKSATSQWKPFAVYGMMKNFKDLGQELDSQNQSSLNLEHGASRNITEVKRSQDYAIR